MTTRPAPLGPRTVRCGLIGTGIGASLTPAMHMREGREQGLDYAYELIDLGSTAASADLGAVLAEAEARGFAGVNVTHPCKQAVIPHLHGLSDEAAALGAVNTVVFAQGRRTGHNTDWWGFAESLRRGLPDARLDDVVLLGAGGAGAAVGYAALTLGARRLAVFDVVADRAAALAATLGRLFPHRAAVAGTALDTAIAGADGLIHATPTGMAGHPGLPLPEALLSPRHWVAEIIYFPLETALLAAARRRGCRTLDGGGMAVFQAVGAFRLFTGLPADAERMRRHFAALTADAPEPTR